MMLVAGWAIQKCGQQIKSKIKSVKFMIFNLLISSFIKKMENYDEIEVLYVKAEDVENIVFTAEQNVVGDVKANNERSLVEGSGLLSSVESLPLEEHISASQWLSTVHSGSDSGQFNN